MIPKIIHLCWFSNDPYPVEIKMCLDTWQRLLPDFQVKHWTYADAEALDIPFVNQALQARKWAFAADVVRYYAVYQYGGVYMDSDIFVCRRFDELMEGTEFATFNELNRPDKKRFGLQAAFFWGEQGNQFCRDMVDYYKQRTFVQADGTYDETMSPYVMLGIAERHYGYRNVDEEQHLEHLTVYPTHLCSPGNTFPHDPDRVAVHRIYGSWVKKKLGRRIELAVKHVWHVVRYAVQHR